MPIVFDTNATVPSLTTTPTACCVAKALAAAYYAAATTFGVDLDGLTNSSIIAQMQTAVDALYLGIFNSAGYASDVQPVVDSRHTVAKVMKALAPVLFEPTAPVYADENAHNARWDSARWAQRRACQPPRDANTT